MNFWGLVSKVSAASAKSLGVELEIIYDAGDRFRLLDIIEEIVARPNKPDYIIFRPYQGNPVRVFGQIESHGISFVTLEQAFSGKNAIELQRSGQKYKHWIGEVAYNNVKGGELLLNALLEEHLARHPNVEPSIIGLGGNFDALSIARQQVLTDLSHDKRLNQIFPTYWEPLNVATNFKLMLSRYPQTNIFWGAGDLLALEAQKQHQLLFNKPIVIGGFDWLPEALLKIQQGKITASVGGHFLMGAIAITKVLDYQHGINRFQSRTTPYDFELITKDNVHQYLNFMQQDKWDDIDFKQFSTFKMGEKAKELTMQNIIELSQ